jgi:glycosyltransferase involved in cell wall biosynthesis
MKVCIGITTKNRADILEKAIQSALDQDYPNKEILVFDDGSTDATRTLPEKYPNISWQRREESIGLLEARNTMMRNSNADLFVSLDDDAWFLEGDEISEAVELCESDQNIAAIFFDVLQRGTPRFNKVERTAPFPCNIFKGCGHLLRLSAVAEAGYYVPFPVKYGHEEKDLSIRLIDLGYSIYFMPGVHVWHEYTAQARNKLEQKRAFIINDLVFPYRRVPLAYLLPVMTHNIFRKLRRSRENKALVRKAIADFFKLAPGQKKYIDRVKPGTYRKYRQLSKNYLNFLYRNDQNQSI